MASAPTATRTSPADDYGPAGRSAWMDVDWRAHQRWLRLAGRAVNVIDIGSGPPLLFVHGLSGSWTNWLENIPHFAQRHRVIAVDLPGFGHSEMPAERISISGYGRCLDALCDELGIDAATVVGNSMGGFIAAELAISFPQRVERLVLVSAAGVSIEDLEHRPLLALARITEAGVVWAAGHAHRAARRPGLRRLTLVAVCRYPDRIPAPLAAEMIRGSGKPGFIGALEALTSYPIRHRLPEIACPTLVVWGTHDRLVPVRDAGEFERLIPNARKVIFADTGHAPMLERPARFNRALEEFLAE